MLFRSKEAVLEGKKVGHIHFNYINPLPKNTVEIFGKAKKLLVCELNMGQFATYLRSTHPQYKFYRYNKVKGLPFTVSELKDAIERIGGKD